MQEWITGSAKHMWRYAPVQIRVPRFSFGFSVRFRAWFTLTIWLCSQPVLAQTPDFHAQLREFSLQELLAFRSSKSDNSGSIELWLAYASIHEHAQARKWADQANHLITAERVEKKLAVLIDCVIAVQTGALPTATTCQNYQQTIADISDPTLRIMGWHLLTFFYHSTGMASQAIVSAQLALSEAQRQDYAVARMHNNIDILLQQKGLPNRALEHFESAQRALVTRPDPMLSRALAFNLGVSQLRAGSYEEARETIAAALSWIDSTRHQSRYAVAVLFLAEAHIRMREPLKAIQLLKQLLGETELEIDLNSTLHARQIQAVAHIESGQKDRGLSELKQVLAAARAAQNEVRTGEVSLQLAEYASTELALEVLEPLIEHLTAQPPGANLRSALRLRATHKAQAGDYSSAFADEKRALSIDQTLRDDAYDMQLSLLRTKLDLEQQTRQLTLSRQRERELQMQNQVSNLKQAGLVIFLVLLMLVAYLSSSRHSQMRLAGRERQTNQALEVKVEERTQALEQSMAERLNIEEDRRLLQQRLMEGEKLRALGQLTGGVAHDFNNLMTIVRMSAELLRVNPDVANGPALQYVQDIERAAESASDITSDLLAYARRQPLNPENIDLAEFISDNKALFSRTLGVGIELSVALDHAHVRADRSQLTTCMLNLLLNAAEAMAGSGHIQIAVHEKENAEQSTWVEIRVADSGRGMSNATIARATEPFFTTKDIGEGSGLGLSMVYGFAKQSGGDLTINSSPGNGTTISLHLPASTPDLVVQEQQPTPDAETLLRGARLLVVEDQPQVRAVMQRLLSSQGFSVDVVVDGDHARSMLAGDGGYDMLITDVVMPGATNGYELARYGRSLYPNLAVLVISGYANDHDTGLPFLSKPFSLEELRVTVVDMLQQNYNERDRSPAAEQAPSAQEAHVSNG